MFLCRPFYKHIILHWHAAGLAKWLETSIQFRSRAFTYHRMKNADLSIVLSKYNRADAEKLFPQRIRVVSNGIPDPCPGFERDVLPRRKARVAARVRPCRRPDAWARRNSPPPAATRSVSRFFTWRIARARRDCSTPSAACWRPTKNSRQDGSPFSIELMVAGNFVNAAEKAEFDRICATPEGRECVRYLGFVSAAQKDQCPARGRSVLLPHLLSERKPAGESDRGHGLRPAHPHHALAFPARTAAARLPLPGGHLFPGANHRGAPRQPHRRNRRNFPRDFPAPVHAGTIPRRSGRRVSQHRIRRPRRRAAGAALSGAQPASPPPTR